MFARYLIYISISIYFFGVVTFHVCVFYRMYKINEYISIILGLRKLHYKAYYRIVSKDIYSQ